MVFNVYFCPLFITLNLIVSPAMGQEAGMAKVPAGEFQSSLSSQKAHLNEFYIDETEVTQKEYVKVMGPHNFYWKQENHPADQVTWFKARDYCEKVGKRLPTEEEWEKAAKAGTRTRYFWGKNPDASFVWFGGHYDEGHHPVGKKKPNAYGLYDTSGNVLEWTSTRVEVHSKVSSEKMVKQVARGGAFNVSANLVTSTSRLLLYPKNRAFNVGFRCAK